MQKGNPSKPIRWLQHQPRPGSEKRMSPDPIFDYPDKKGLAWQKERINQDDKSEPVEEQSDKLNQ
ncbi:MAG TPA: hypothetical protein VF487_04350 [Chitinophagaceae bacterium]